MKLLLLSGRQVLTALQRLGFLEIHRKGSHVRVRLRRAVTFPQQIEFRLDVVSPYPAEQNQTAVPVFI